MSDGDGAEPVERDGEASEDLRGRLADERARIADERDEIASERARIADEREQQGDVAEAALRPVAPDSAASGLDALTNLTEARRSNRALREDQAGRRASADGEAGDGDGHGDGDATWAAARREFVADDRQLQADRAEALDDERERLADLREAELRDVAMQIGLHLASTAAEREVVLETPAARAERLRNRDDRAAARSAREHVDADHAGRGYAQPLAELLVEVSRLLVRNNDPDQVLADIVTAARDVVPGSDAASFSKPEGTEIRTVASTGPMARDIDQLQYEHHQGPCVEAISTSSLVKSDELATDPRWPDLAVALAALTTAVSAMASPILDERFPDDARGSLNSYGEGIGAFDQESEDCVMLLTAHLGAVMSLAARSADADTKTLQLTEAIESRDVIGQAKGILMERRGLTADQAFDVLVRASQNLNRKLRDIATDLVHTGRLLDS